MGDGRLKIETMGNQDINVIEVTGFKGPTKIKINKEMEGISELKQQEGFLLLTLRN